MTQLFSGRPDNEVMLTASIPRTSTQILVMRSYEPRIAAAEFGRGDGTVLLLEKPEGLLQRNDPAPLRYRVFYPEGTGAPTLEGPRTWRVFGPDPENLSALAHLPLGRDSSQGSLIPMAFGRVYRSGQLTFASIPASSLDAYVSGEILPWKTHVDLLIVGACGGLQSLTDEKSLNGVWLHRPTPWGLFFPSGDQSGLSVIPWSKLKHRLIGLGREGDAYAKVTLRPAEQGLEETEVDLGCGRKRRDGYRQYLDRVSGHHDYLSVRWGKDVRNEMIRRLRSQTATLEESDARARYATAQCGLLAAKYLAEIDRRPGSLPEQRQCWLEILRNHIHQNAALTWRAPPAVSTQDRTFLVAVPGEQLIQDWALALGLFLSIVSSEEETSTNPYR